MKFTTFLFFSLFTILSCGRQEKNKTSKQNKTKETETTYALIIERSGELKAKLTTIQDANGKLQSNLLECPKKDTIGRTWHLKISSRQNFKIDTNFKARNKTEFKSVINSLFAKIPYQTPSNCNYKFEKNKFEPVEAILGNQIDTSKLNRLIIKKITNGQNELVLTYENSYKKPNYFLNHAKSKQGLKDLKKCLSALINYELNDTKIKISKEEFGPWLKLDTAMKVDFFDAKMAKFIQQIASKHDVIEKSVTFNTTLGETKTINGGDIGVRIDVYGEVRLLQKDIISGEEVTREPKYGMKGIPVGTFNSNKNYVEVSIAAQKLWCYKNNELVLESDVVTGCPRRGHATPSGAYYVKYKAKNVVLDGPGYSSHVSYWMPFNKGIGLHDARWRRKFGGSIFQADGSHGCVNLPKATAEIIYGYLSPGAIVLCY